MIPILDQAEKARSLSGSNLAGFRISRLGAFRVVSWCPSHSVRGFETEAPRRSGQRVRDRAKTFNP